MLIQSGDCNVTIISLIINIHMYTTEAKARVVDRYIEKDLHRTRSILFS